MYDRSWCPRILLRPLYNCYLTGLQYRQGLESLVDVTKPAVLKPKPARTLNVDS